MLLLKPDGRIDLEHRAYFLRGVSQQYVIVAASEDGQLSVVRQESHKPDSHRLPSKVRAVSPHPSGRRLAWVNGDSGLLTVHTFDGKRLLEITAPPVREGTPTWIKQGFEDCHFDESGEFLWLAAPRNIEECEIQLIETEDWSLVDKATFKDPFGGSSYSFHHTGRPGLVSLWLAAGQDGQQVYWLNRNRKGFCCTLEPCLKNTMPPVFSPSGEHVLVVNERNAICKYDYPNMHQIGLPLELGDEDNPFAESLVYLNEQQALASSREGRIFVVDTVRLKIEEEVAVEGHEPRPIGEYYPTLANERGLGTDISYFAKLGSMIFFVYRRDRGSDLAGWKDTLLWMSVKERG
jgi:hypothetical protein